MALIKDRFYSVALPVRPKSTRYALTDKDIKGLHDQAETKGRSIRVICAMACKEYLANHEKEIER